MRAIWSDAPPAPAATTISTGLVGSHAAAGAAESATASTVTARRQRLLLITSPPHSHGRMALEPRPNASLPFLGILPLCALHSSGWAFIEQAATLRRSPTAQNVRSAHRAFAGVRPRELIPCGRAGSP